MESSKQGQTTLKIGGMTCINCQSKIESRLSKLNGVRYVKASWKKGTAAVDFDEGAIRLERIVSEIQSLGYKVLNEKPNSKQILTSIIYLAVIVTLFLILQKSGAMNLLVPTSIASSKMTYALLFVTGLLTSVHCAAMCGGINLSQSLGTARQKAFLKPLLYNLGRVASYTLIGLALGAAGFFLGGAKSEELSIPLFAQGLLKLIAGVVMILTGISLLGIFPFLRYITPHLPSFISKKIASAQVQKRTPFIVGFLNGFMPCGPLQAMWVVALASQSPVSGALSMLFFSAGTVPLMLGLGSIVSILGKKYTEVVMKIGALLIVVMGLSMASQGFALGGWNSSKSQAKPAALNIVIKDGKQIVKSVLNPFRYPEITVKKGIPVHWEIEATEETLNGCNYRMIFKDFGFNYQMGYGTNVIEFTPEKAGTFTYICWMGMVTGAITVEE